MKLGKLKWTFPANAFSEILEWSPMVKLECIWKGLNWNTAKPKDILASYRGIKDKKGILVDNALLLWIMQWAEMTLE